MEKNTKWGDLWFEVRTLHDAQKSTNGGIFIFAGKNKNINNIWETTWNAYLIEETENLQTLFYHNQWTAAQKLGATHVHIRVEGISDRKIHLKQLIEQYKPTINNIIQSVPMEATMSEKSKVEENTIEEHELEMPDELAETEAKLELLYQYERHYLELIKEYKEEIKFANTLQEDLRRERSQFFTQTLKEIVQTMKGAEVDKNVAAQWLEDLVSSYSKSIDLSSDLAKTHVIQVLSIFKEEAKQEVAKAKLDSLK
jgi:hypothetical protein